jgi:hypothetical protein
MWSVQSVSVIAWDDYRKAMPVEVWMYTLWALYTTFLDHSLNNITLWTLAAIKIV